MFNATTRSGSSCSSEEFGTYRDTIQNDQVEFCAVVRFGIGADLDVTFVLRVPPDPDDTDYGQPNQGRRFGSGMPPVRCARTTVSRQYDYTDSYTNVATLNMQMEGRTTRLILHNVAPLGELQSTNMKHRSAR